MNKSFFTLLCCLVGLVQTFAVEPDRILVQYTDGSELTGKRLQKDDFWVHGQSNLLLDKTPVFAPDKTVKLILNRSLKPNLAGSWLEMANGDFLPGAVENILPAEPDRNLPQRLAVRLSGSINAFTEGAAVEVRADRVVRLVAVAPGHAQEKPGTLWFKDGRDIEVKAGRWRSGGVRVLTSTGVDFIPLEVIGEWQRANTDRIEALQAEAADGRLVRFETDDGAVLTCREDRMVRHHSRMLLIQPEWAFDSIAVGTERIVSALYRSSNTIPLSLLPAETLREESFTGFHWPWRRNRNVEGGPLQAGERFSPLGIGAHAYSALAFDLPPNAETFTTEIGIDHSTGRGGCVRCSIYAENLQGQPLWQSPFLIGKDEPVKCGPISVRGIKRLILVTDYGHEGRPAGADPFDIRDRADWIEPVVTCAPSTPAQSAGGLLEQYPFLEGWVLSETAPECKLISEWNPRRGRWVSSFRPRQEIPSAYEHTMLEPGLYYEFFNDYDAPELPENFSGLKPTEVGYLDELSPVIRNKKEGRYGLQTSSSLIVPREGVYMFSSAVRGAMRFYLDDKLVMANDQYQEVRKLARLKKGPVKIRFDYLADPEYRYMSFAWMGPGIPRESVPASAFDRSREIEPVRLDEDFLEVGDREDVATLTLKQTRKIASSNAWFCLRADRGHEEFGEYVFELRVNGEVVHPLAHGSERTYDHSSTQYTAPSWWLGDYAGRTVDLELDMLARGYPGQYLPTLSLDRAGFGPRQSADFETIRPWVGTWWLAASQSSVQRENHPGPLHGSHGFIRILEDGSFYLDGLLPSGARYRTVGSLRAENGLMQVDYLEERWTDDVARLADGGQSIRIEDPVDPKAWTWVMTKQRDRRLPELSGRWYLLLEQSCISNKVYQGSMVGGSCGMSIADDGSVAVKLRYPTGGESRVIGQAEQIEEGFVFHYNDGDWNDDRVSWDPETEILQVREIGNEENWSLKFKRTSEKY